LPTNAPICSDVGTVTNAWKPGTLRSSPRSCCATTGAGGRCERGVSITCRRAAFMPPMPPVVTVIDSMFGFAFRIAPTCCACPSIS